MSLALIIVAGLLGIAATGSAVQKLRRDPMVVQTLRSVGVRDAQIPILATLELLAAAGLLVGIWIPPVGIAAAIGLTLYFLGAVIAHVRAGGAFKEAMPAAVLMLLAAATAILEVAR